MNTIAFFGLVALSNALPQALIPAGCGFHLSASGGPGGNVGQLVDGQNRIGQSNLPVPQGQYFLADNGGLTDALGRGCILTPPTTQFQCDTGASPTTGFTVECDGKLLYMGNPDFWACPTGDNGGYNIYTQQVAGEPNCVQITLTSDNAACASGCSTPTPAPPPPPAQSTCPGTLPAGFEYPHLILAVDSSKPDQPSTNGLNGTACGTISSVFNFDIPSTDAQKTCTLSFLFPTQAQLETSSFSFAGSGAVQFAQLASPGTEEMTWSGMPQVGEDYGSTTVAPGNAYTIGTFPCPAGDKIGVSMTAQGTTCLDYFQDYNPCPIGLYITVA